MSCDTSEPQDLLGLVAGTFADRFIGCQDVGGIAPGHGTVLDLAVEDAVLEERTDKYSPGRVRLLSWTGKCDGIVELDDYEAFVASRPASRPPTYRHG